MADQVITCSDCGQEFVFTESEQAFYADRGFSTPAAAPPAAQRRRPPAPIPAVGRTGAPRTAAAPLPTGPRADRARCSRLRAARAATSLPSRSGRRAPSPSTAPTASAGANSRSRLTEGRPGTTRAAFEIPESVPALERDRPPPKPLNAPARSKKRDEPIRHHVAPPSAHHEDDVARPTRAPASRPSRRPCRAPRPASALDVQPPGEGGRGGDRRVGIATGMNLRDDDAVGTLQDIREGVQHRRRPMVGQGLVDRPQPAPRIPLGDRVERGGHGRRMVAVVVEHDDTADVGLELEAASDPGEDASRRADLGQRHPGGDRDAGGDERVLCVVAAGQRRWATTGRSAPGPTISMVPAVCRAQRPKPGGQPGGGFQARGVRARETTACRDGVRTGFDHLDRPRDAPATPGGRRSSCGRLRPRRSRRERGAPLPRRTGGSMRRTRRRPPPGPQRRPGDPSRRSSGRRWPWSVRIEVARVLVGLHDEVGSLIRSAPCSGGARP